MITFTKSNGKYKADSAAVSGQDNAVTFAGAALGEDWELTVYNKSDIAVVVSITDNQTVIPAEVVAGSTLYPTLTRETEIIQCAALAVKEA